MKPSHDLFELISALSKSEKRYVSLYLSTGLHGSNKPSLQLFKAIAAQETYNEILLKKKLSKAITSRFSAEKNKLFALVLDSMLLYYRDRTEEKKVNALRYEAAFLFSKNLRAAGWRHLRKARSLSDEVESFATSIQLAYREELEVRKSPVGEVVFEPGETRARNHKLVLSLSEDLELYTLYTEMIQLEKRYGTLINDIRESLENIMRHPLMDTAHELAAFSSRVHRLEIRALYYKMTGDHQLAFQCWNEMVALYDTSPGNIAHAYGRYTDVLLNRLQGALIAREYAVFYKLLQPTRKALESIRKYLGHQIDLILFSGPELLELLALTNSANAQRGPAVLQHMEKRFRVYERLISYESRIAALFLMGTYHFYLCNLKKALSFYNELTDSTRPDQAQNYQCMVRLIKLCVHYDLGHTDLLPALSLSTARLLNQQGRMGEAEKLLLSFFKGAPETADRKKLEQLNSALAKVAPITQYGTWCEFDFTAWVQGGLSKVALHKLVAMNRFNGAEEK